MGNIITGAEISTYKTTAITVSKAKKENRNGIIPRFLILQLKDKGSVLSKPSRVVLFEEDLDPAIFEILSRYQLLDKDGKPVVDSRGGRPIDLKALKNSEDFEDLEPYMQFEGGMVMDYDLGGEYYANDVDGNPTMDGQNNRVVKRSISVFVQVKHFLPTENGGLKPVFYSGMGLEERGSRMKAQFYRTPVQQTIVPTEQSGETTNDPF